MWRILAASIIGIVFGAIAAGCQNGNVSAGNSAIVDNPPTIVSSPLPIAPASGMVIIHTVQRGENLFRIARLYGTSVEAITKANHIADPKMIQVGQKLIIPPIQATTEPEPTDIPIPTLTLTPTSTPPLITLTPIVSTTTQATNGTPPPPPDNVNGVKIDTFVVMPPAVQENMRRIFATGQALGRNPRAFSKVGDSTIENPHFLARFDSGPYNLADYAYLQPVIDYFHGSFSRQGMAVRRGLHSWSVLNPAWADKDNCEPNESPLACEFRLNNPSLVLIRLGSNDVGAPELFKQSVQNVITYSIESGVIPVIGTKADRHEGPGNINNNILRELAAANNLPLWDFDLVADTLPNHGLASDDDTHMSFFYAHDYSLPEAFTKGHAVHNLTALIVLDRIRKVLTPPN
jgi:LysM repeat protein